MKELLVQRPVSIGIWLRRRQQLPRQLLRQLPRLQLSRLQRRGKQQIMQHLLLPLMLLTRLATVHREPPPALPL
jgi:hypothetical protein